MELYDELVARGLIAQVTDEKDDSRKRMQKGERGAYIYTEAVGDNWEHLTL